MRLRWVFHSRYHRFLGLPKPKHCLVCVLVHHQQRPNWTKELLVPRSSSIKYQMTDTLYWKMLRGPIQGMPGF